MKIREALKTAVERLQNEGDQSSRLDAEVLLLYILKKDRTFLIMEPSYELSEEEEKEYFQMINERASGRPVSYITGEKEFMGLAFKVCEGILIPRPDTEILVEEALALLKSDSVKEKRVLDMCTGSGAIAVSIAYYAENTRVTGVDISETAVRVAEENSRINGVENKVDIVQSDMFGNIDESVQLDMIVSNPPYIKKEVIGSLMKDVRDFEPALALDGGEDGLDFYRILVSEAALRLRQGGSLLMEIGYDQGEEVSDLLRGSGKYTDIRVLKDLAGLDRVVCADKV